MNHTLEAQIRHLADEAEAQLDATSDAVDHRRDRRGQHRSGFALVAAATVVLIAGVAGLVLIDRDDASESVGDVVAGQPTDDLLPPVVVAPRPIPENTPNLAVAVDETWFALAELPDGFEFVRAIDHGAVTGDGGPSWRSVEYESIDGATTIAVSFEAPPIGLDEPTESIVIAGETWAIGPLSDNGHDLGAVRGERTERDDGWPYHDITVTASEVTRDSFVSLLGLVDEVPASELPRVPLPAFAPDGDIVARGVQDGRDVVLRAVTDGRSFVTSFETTDGGGGGGPIRLGSDWIVVDGAAGPTPGLVADGDAESLIYGLVHPDVAEIAVELTDGTLIRSAPQDEYGFEEDFFLIAFPTSTENGLERFAAVIAYDTHGNELQRDTTYAE